VTGRTARFFNSCRSFASDLSEADCLELAQIPGFTGMNSACATKKLRMADTLPGCFLQEWQTKKLTLTWLVRVANTRLKVGLFSFSCGRTVRAARKGVSEIKLRVESSKFKEEGVEPDARERGRIGETGRERNMRHGSRISYQLSIDILFTEWVIRTGRPGFE
jgi:hypothetical protein